MKIYRAGPVEQALVARFDAIGFLGEVPVRAALETDLDIFPENSPGLKRRRQPLVAEGIPREECFAVRRLHRDFEFGNLCRGGRNREEY